MRRRSAADGTRYVRPGQPQKHPELPVRRVGTSSTSSEGSIAMGRYQQEFQRSPTQPDEFWRAAARLIDWYTEPGVVLDRSGKILRKTMRGIAEGGDEPVPSTI